MCAWPCAIHKAVSRLTMKPRRLTPWCINSCHRRIQWLNTTKYCREYLPPAFCTRCTWLQPHCDQHYPSVTRRNLNLAIAKNDDIICSAARVCRVLWSKSSLEQKIVEKGFCSHCNAVLNPHSFFGLLLELAFDAASSPLTSSTSEHLSWMSSAKPLRMRV